MLDASASQPVSPRRRASWIALSRCVTACSRSLRQSAAAPSAQRTMTRRRSVSVRDWVRARADLRSATAASIAARSPTRRARASAISMRPKAYVSAASPLAGAWASATSIQPSASLRSPAASRAHAARSDRWGRAPIDRPGHGLEERIGGRRARPGRRSPARAGARAVRPDRDRRRRLRAPRPRRGGRGRRASVPREPGRLRRAWARESSLRREGMSGRARGSGTTRLRRCVR